VPSATRTRAAGQARLVVGDEDERLARAGGEQRLELTGRGRVERRQRLVEYEKVGGSGQRGGERDSLRLPL
jgi:hypothetical protein